MSESKRQRFWLDLLQVLLLIGFVLNILIWAAAGLMAVFSDDSHFDVMRHRNGLDALVMFAVNEVVTRARKLD